MTTNDETNITDVEFENLGDLFGEGSAASIMIPEGSEDPKKSVFSPVTPDTSFLDKGVNPNGTTSAPSAPAASTAPVADPAAPAGEQSDDDNLLDLSQPGADSKDSKQTAPGAGSINAVIQKLVDGGQLFPFDDGKDISSYTAEDIEELLQANLQEKEKTFAEQTTEAFYNSLPPQLQQAYEYVANGGQDMKGMFRALAEAQETFELSTKTESGQEQVVRTYLQTTRYGTPEEIEEEIAALKDRGDLEKKANQFKPKLDTMQEQMVEQKIAAQQQARERQAQQARAYQQNLYAVLEKGELNGVKLDGRTQDLLYAGLIQPNYPSISGKPTNLLGHLLEKYQWVEPRHDLIAEALYLLADPDGYRAKIKSMGETASAETIARNLKTEQSQRTASNGVVNDEENNQRHATRTVSRPKKGFFAR